MFNHKRVWQTLILKFAKAIFPDWSCVSSQYKHSPLVIKGDICLINNAKWVVYQMLKRRSLQYIILSKNVMLMIGAVEDFFRKFLKRQSYEPKLNTLSELIKFVWSCIHKCLQHLRWIWAETVWSFQGAKSSCFYIISSRQMLYYCSGITNLV